MLLLSNEGKLRDIEHRLCSIVLETLIRVLLSHISMFLADFEQNGFLLYCIFYLALFLFLRKGIHSHFGCFGIMEGNVGDFRVSVGL